MFSFELEWSRESYFSFIDKKRCWQRKLPWEWVKSGDADCGVLVKRYKWSVAECQEWNPRFGNSVLFLTPRLLFTLVYSVFSKLPCTFPNWGQNPIHLSWTCFSTIVLWNLFLPIYSWRGIFPHLLSPVPWSCSPMLHVQPSLCYSWIYPLAIIYFYLSCNYFLNC